MSDNKRIAKNTILLYGRLLIVMAISLYISRAALHLLGETDFGIYNLIAGFVVLFSFISNAMTVSTQRFITYNLGLGDKGDPHKVFCIAVMGHLAVSFIVLLLAESIGLWFVITQLNIPVERSSASMYVYQFAVITIIFNIISIPYQSSIIAEERMDLYAYISLTDIFLKLVVVLLIPYCSFDKLVYYSFSYLTVSFIIFLLYRFICRKRFLFARFSFIWDKKAFVEQMSFSGWYLFGGVAYVGSRYGANVLLNIFWGVTTNAAFAIANQVRNAVNSFVSSFQSAFNPQLVKSYASEDYDDLLVLLYRSSRFSYFLYSIFAIPIFIFCDDVLSLWLVEVPNYTLVFTRLVIISVALEVFSNPLLTVIGATGDVKRYQSWISAIVISALPVMYIFLKLGYNPYIVFLIDIIANSIALWYRFFYIKKKIQFSLKKYVKDVVWPCLISSVVSIILLLFIFQIRLDGYWNLLKFLTGIFVCCMSIITLGLSASERITIYQAVKVKIIGLLNFINK